MMRRGTPLLVAAALAATIAACGGDDPGAPAGGGGSDGGGKSYAAVIKGLDNPFFAAMQDGIDAEAKRSGTTVEVQAAQSITDTSGQSDRLSAMAGQEFSCFVVNPISGTNLVAGLAQIAARDIPVVNIDSPIDADAAKKAGLELETYIGTDNVQAGRVGGAAMIEAIGSGKVALIGGISGDATSGARLEGFKEAVAGKLEIAGTVAADWDRQVALTRATDLLGAQPKLKGFFVANDDMALGVARAAANQGVADRVKIISVDGIKDGVEAVKAGDIYASVAQYPYAIGELGVQACAKAVGGGELPKNVTAPIALVTKANADAALKAFPAPFEEYENPLR